MKSKQKKFLGLLGLFGVAAITTVAILMPQPGVSAVGSSVTDTISIKVVRENMPWVEISAPADKTRLTGPELDVSVNYGYLLKGKVTITRTEPKGEPYVWPEFTSDYRESGTQALDTLNLATQFGDFGYGRYTITATGGVGGDEATPHSVEVIYNVMNPGGGETTDPSGKPEFKVDPETGDPVVDPGIDPNDPNVHQTEVKVYPVDGPDKKPGEGADPSMEQEIPRGETWTPKFREHCLQSGWYYFQLTAQDEEGNTVGVPEDVWFYWEAPDHCVPIPDEEPMPAPSTGSPNTGGLFKDLNVSREDALITGMVVFLALAALGTVFVVRKKAATPKRKRR